MNGLASSSNNAAIVERKSRDPLWEAVKIVSEQIESERMEKDVIGKPKEVREGAEASVIKKNEMKEENTQVQEHGEDIKGTIEVKIHKDQLHVEAVNKEEKYGRRSLPLSVLKEIRLHQQLVSSPPSSLMRVPMDNILQIVRPSSLAPPSPTEHADSQWHCAICYQNLGERNPHNISCSTYDFCTACLAQYLQVNIEEKTSKMSSRWTISCPCSVDGCEFMKADIERIIELAATEDEEFASTKDVLLKKYNDFALDLEVQRDSSRVFCPQRNCSAIVTLPPKRNFILFSSKQAKCRECQHVFCVKCNNSHSRFLSCDTSSEAKFNRWRRSTKQGCKKCPGCRMYIEKNEGCSHMTCRSCGTHFCWHCLRPTHGDSIYCQALSVHHWEGWGQNRSTRIVTKTAAVPATVVAGGFIIGAAGVAAGIAVAAAGLFICASPVIGGVRYYRKQVALKTASTFTTVEKLMRGIVIVFPADLESCWNTVESLVRDRHISSVTMGYMMPADVDPPQYLVAYSDRYMLYFTNNPRIVPGYESIDENDLNETESRIQSDRDNIPAYDLQHSIEKTITSRRGYIHLPRHFLDSLRTDADNIDHLTLAQGGDLISEALQTLYSE